MNTTLQIRSFCLSVKRIVFLFCFWSMCLNLGHSQTLLKNREEVVSQSDLVVLAEILKKQVLLDSFDYSIYTQYTLSVDSTFKGSSSKIFHFLIQGGEIDNRFQYVSHTPEFQVGDRGVFMLVRIDQYWKERTRPFAPYSDFKLTFDESNSFLAFPTVNRAKKQQIESKFDSQSESDKIECIQNKAPQLNVLPQLGVLCDSVTESRCDIGIGDVFIYDSIWIANITMKTEPSGLELGQSQVFITYNTSTFGSFAIANNVFRLESLAPFKQKYTFLFSDFDSNTIEISIQPIDDLDLSALDETPKPVFCLTHENPSNSSMIGLLDTDVEGTISFRCGRTYEPFDRVQYSGFNGSIVNGDNIGITYYGGCVYSSVNSPDRMELALKASSTSPTQLFEGKIVITYNKDAIQYLGYTASSSFSFYTFTVDGNQPGRVEIFIDGISALPVNLSTLFNAPKLLMDMEFDVIDCNAETNIEFETPSMQLGSWYFPIGGTASVPYFPVLTEIGCGNEICCISPPVIDRYFSSFDAVSSPAKIRAGMGDIMTIVGTNFGSYDSDFSKIVMVNADQPSEEVVIPVVSILLWSDTEIQIMLPGSVTGFTRPPGSGAYRVETKCGKSNVDIVNIIYSILGAITSNRFLFAQGALLNNGTKPEFIFEVNKNLHLASLVRSELETATDSWCGVTNINWTVSGTLVDTEVSASDGLNVVGENAFANSAAGAKVIVTGSYFDLTSGCTDAMRYFSDVDIAVNEAALPNDIGGWPGFANKMQTILRHELGHAHGLNHSINLDAGLANGCLQPIMYYSADFCNQVVGIKAYDIEGAKTVFGRSLDIITNCPPGSIYSPILDNGCSVNVSEIVNSALQLEISPNPNFGEFFVSFKNAVEVDAIEIIGTDGVIHAVINEIAHNNDSKVNINIDELPAGLYFIKCSSSNGKLSYSKFTKI